MGNPKYQRAFEFTTHLRALEIPLTWKRPRRIFVNSMSDLFHEVMPNDFLTSCFEIMAKANWHVYQVLTKRPERMLRFMKNYDRVLDHVWLGTSVELSMYKPRIEILKNVPSKVRFISFEPLLGPLGKLDLSGISWAIVGGESGPHHRPIKPEWVREIRDQCLEQSVAFFFKQWGGQTAKSGGRILDGREWSQYPSEIEHLYENHTQLDQLNAGNGQKGHSRQIQPTRFESIGSLELPLL
jgi:protein gp37